VLVVDSLGLGGYDGRLLREELDQSKMIEGRAENCYNLGVAEQLRDRLGEPF
jgi:hypothetical protein